jgi:hypothetical protein
MFACRPRDSFRLPVGGQPGRIAPGILRFVVPSVSHSQEEETPEAKARWFKSLPMEERMRIFCDMCDMIIAVRPDVLEAKNAQPVSGRVRVLTAPRR